MNEGGGTITYVTPHNHLYDVSIEHREEGGTPGNNFIITRQKYCDMF
jgi:hypothetical protein